MEGLVRLGESSVASCRERPTRVDHLNAMLDGNLDNLVTGKIGSDGGVLAALANDVSLVGLCESVSTIRGEREVVILCLCMLRRSS